MPYLREDQARVMVQVETVPLPNTPWQVFEGGDIEASNTNTRPGDMDPSVDLGGPVQRTDVTVRRLYDSDTLHSLLPALEQACGRAKFTVSWTPLDADGNPHGQTIVQTGILKQVTHPNYDANATAAQQLTLVAGMNQVSSTASNT